MIDKLDRFKAFIFDFNGTILWDTHLHNSAWDDFLFSHKIYLTDQEKNEVIHGKTNKDIFEKLFDRPIDNDELDKLSEEKEEKYRQLVISSQIKLAEGTTELFEKCREKSIEILIATSSYVENTKFFIDHFNLLKWFKQEHIFCNDGKMKSKPDPEVFNNAIQYLGFDRKDIVIFEDSPAGILAAEKAKVGKIVIVNSMKEDHVNKDYAVVESFLEIQIH